MISFRSLRSRLVDLLHRYPTDLIAVVGLTVLVVLVVLLPGVRETRLRILFTLPFVLFIPGYAFISALFPEASEATTLESDYEWGFGSYIRDRGITGFERAALSFGLSISLVPLIGSALTFTPWGIQLISVLISLSGFTLITTVVASVRRTNLPEEERFSVPYDEWILTIRLAVLESTDRRNHLLNALVILSILLAASSVAYAITVPQDEKQFTEFYLLTQDGNDKLIADNYPDEFVQGEGQSLIVGISNHEGKTIDYTVVIQLQYVENGKNGTEVQDQEELDRFTASIERNESWRQEHRVSPERTGEDLRLTYLLYTDDPPETPTRENAYRHLDLWIDIEEDDNEIELTSPVENGSSENTG